MSNPRQEFVEAVGWLRRHGERYTKKAIYLDDLKWLRRACIAFADESCKGNFMNRLHAAELYDEHVGYPNEEGGAHNLCRAALLREVGLEEHDA